MKPFNQISLALMFILLFFINLKAAPGDLDTSFNGTGFTRTQLGDSDELISATVIQSDGKIVTAGYAFSGTDNDFALARYNLDGSLDTNFNGNGKVLTSIGTASDSANAVAIQSDGKIVVAGQAVNSAGNSDFAVVRYNADGTIDATFGTNGKVVTAIGAASDVAYSVLIQSDGRIVAAGTFRNGSTSSFAVVRYNLDGSLDTNFGTNGKATTTFTASNSSTISAALQNDGKIILAGNSSNGANSDFALARYNTDGTLDTTFGTNGKVITPVGASNDFAYAVAVQTDGKIVAAGSANNGSNDDFAAVRYNSDGTLDTTLNGSGKVITPIGAGYDAANAVAIQTDGKIVAAGISNNGTNNDFALARYNSNGTFDTTFNGSGKVTTPIGTSFEYANSVVIQTDGRIIAAGVTNNGINNDFALIRYNTDGSLDLTFGTSGKLVTRELGSNSSLQAIAIQTDGKIVAVGNEYNGAFNFAAARYNTNGTLDTTFGTNGKVITSFSATRDSGATSVAIQTDGKIVAAGFFADITTDFAVVRYNTDGSLDNTFNGSGKVTTPIGTSSDEAYSITIQSNGKIVVAGYSFGTSADFAVVRYNTDGTLDTTFNGSGKVTTPVGAGDDFARSVKTQSDGKIVVAGYASNGANNDFAVVRYNTNGSLDNSFDADGKVTTAIGTANDYAYSAAIQSDGKIIAAGSAASSADSSFALIRYNTNGSLDTSFGTSGKVTTQIGPTTDYINSIAIQTDDKIVAAGANFIDSVTYDYALARYNADGTLDSAFGTSGIIKTNISKRDTIGSMALQTDGKIVLGGTSGGQFTILRYFGRFLYEADVSPRSDGDGFVDADDIQQIRLFSVGGGLPYQSNEFQRVDCSPRSTLGDGFLDSDDVQQARRYSVGTDSSQLAGGPSSGSAPFLLDSATSAVDETFGSSTLFTNRKSKRSPAFHIGGQINNADQTITVPVLIDATGKEAGYTFSLSYDAEMLSNPQVAIGNAGGDVVFNANTAGHIGFSVTSFSGETIAPEANQVLVNVTFKMAANAVAGTTAINFTDTLARRKASGVDPNSAITQPTYTGGIITIGNAKMVRNTFNILNN